MAYTKGSTNVRNVFQTGKSSLLPPKIPFPSASTVYADYNTNPSAESKVTPKHKDFNSYHQRTSSESLIGEEQPSWLDDLLNEPDTPIRRGHRRASSDSFAYMDMAGASKLDYASRSYVEAEHSNMALPQMWRSHDIDCFKPIQHGSPYADQNSYSKPMNQTWEWPLTSARHPRNPPSLRDNNIPLSEGPSSAPAEADPFPSAVTEKRDHDEAGLLDSNFLSETDDSHAKMASDNDSKRAKQKFAQRSRVRKLQYIAELERAAQALQTEGSEVSAELEFLNQQRLILSMENKTLKHRLESLSQEQLIKRLEHEMLERELGRLRAVYQQQQQQQHEQHQRQSTSTHRRSNSKDLDSNKWQSTSTHRTNSKDLDSQFATLSLKHKRSTSGADTVHI